MAGRSKTLAELVLTEQAWLIDGMWWRRAAAHEIPAVGQSAWLGIGTSDKDRSTPLEIQRVEITYEYLGVDDVYNACSRTVAPKNGAGPRNVGLNDDWEYIMVECSDE